MSAQHSSHRALTWHVPYINNRSKRSWPVSIDIVVVDRHCIEFESGWKKREQVLSMQGDGREEAPSRLLAV